MGQLRTQNEIFAVSVGDRSGSVLLAAKIFDDPKYSVDKARPLPASVKYRVHRVDLSAEPKTESYQYLDNELHVVDQEVVAPNAITYDARTKPWFEQATKKKANVWTDVTIYPSGQFGTSNAEPVVDPNGAVRLVVSSTIALSLRDGLTSRLNVAQHGIAFVLDEQGRLIAHPDRAKITRCGEPSGCRFNNVHEIGDDALAAAFDSYKKTADLRDPANIPPSLDHHDYAAAVGKLEPRVRSAFDQLYAVDAKSETITLRDGVSPQARDALPEVLGAIGYSYYVRFESGHKEYLASFHGFPGHYGKPWAVGAIVPIDDFIGDLKRTMVTVALISLGIMLASIAFIVVAARRLMRPLALISSDMTRIQRLEIDESIRHTSFFYEIDQIGRSLASMKTGLKAFSKFVPVTLVKQLIASGKGAELGGEKRRLTIMFSDIEGFTTISESMATEALLPHISEYLDHLTTIILGEGGTVDKYIGDAIMCFWGAPVPAPEQEAHACRAALLCTAKLQELNARWAAEGKPELRTRFGLNSGELSVGNMGSRERMNYTVLGDAANLASRLEAINKYYGTRVIIGEATFEVVKAQFSVRPVDVVAVKGKTRGVRIFELIGGLPGDPQLAPSADDLARIALTEQAFTAYLARDFVGARALYKELSRRFPEDALGAVFDARCEEYLSEPPADDWVGVTTMKSK
jgi:class 3 adenylate cyclase